MTDPAPSPQLVKIATLALLAANAGRYAECATHVQNLRSAVAGYDGPAFDRLRDIVSRIESHLYNLGTNSHHRPSMN